QRQEGLVRRRGRTGPSGGGRAGGRGGTRCRSLDATRSRVPELSRSDEPPRRTKDPAGRRPVRLGLGVVAAPRCRHVSAGIAERPDGPHRTGRDRRSTRGAVGTSAVRGDERGGLVAVAVREPFTRPRARHGTSHDHARVFPYLTPILRQAEPTSAALATRI